MVLMYWVGGIGNVYAFLTSRFDQLFDQEVGPVGAFLTDYAGQGVQPLLGFLGIGVCQGILRVRGHVLSPHDLRVVGGYRG